MYTTTNTRLRHTADPTIRNLSLSSGQPLRYLDFPTHPNRQTPRHTNQGGSSKHARHFLFFFLEHRPVPPDAGDNVGVEFAYVVLKPLDPPFLLGKTLADFLFTVVDKFCKVVGQSLVFHVVDIGESGADGSDDGRGEG